MRRSPGAERRRPSWRVANGSPFIGAKPRRLSTRKRPKNLVPAREAWAASRSFCQWVVRTARDREPNERNREQRRQDLDRPDVQDAALEAADRRAGPRAP